MIPVYNIVTSNKQLKKKRTLLWF